MADKPQPFKTREKIKLSDFDPIFPDHTWSFWKNPDRDTFLALLAPYDLAQLRDKKGSVTPEAEKEFYDRFYAAIPEMVLDTGESNLDLSTIDKVRAQMESNQNNNEIIGGAVLQYAARLFERLGVIQKKTGAPLTGSVTGAS